MHSVSNGDPENIEERLERIEERYRAEVKRIQEEKEKGWVAFVWRHPWLLGLLAWIAIAATLVFMATVDAMITGGCK